MFKINIDEVFLAPIEHRNSISFQETVCQHSASLFLAASTAKTNVIEFADISKMQKLL